MIWLYFTRWYLCGWRGKSRIFFLPRLNFLFVRTLRRACQWVHVPNFRCSCLLRPSFHLARFLALQRVKYACFQGRFSCKLLESLPLRISEGSRSPYLTYRSAPRWRLFRNSNDWRAALTSYRRFVSIRSVQRDVLWTKLNFSRENRHTFKFVVFHVVYELLKLLKEIEIMIMNLFYWELVLLRADGNRDAAYSKRVAESWVDWVAETFFCSQNIKAWFFHDSHQQIVSRNCKFLWT